MVLMWGWLWPGGSGIDPFPNWGTARCREAAWRLIQCVCCRLGVLLSASVFDAFFGLIVYGICFPSWLPK